MKHTLPDQLYYECAFISKFKTKAANFLGYSSTGQAIKNIDNKFINWNVKGSPSNAVFSRFNNLFGINNINNNKWNGKRTIYTERTRKIFNIVKDLDFFDFYKLLIKNKKNKQTVNNDFKFNVTFYEGEKSNKNININKRNREARNKCLDFWKEKTGKISCVICGWCPGEIYGEKYSRCIHVHHINPISSNSHKHAVNPVTDLIPVCPNCHSIIHYSEEKIIKKTSKDC